MEQIFRLLLTQTTQMASLISVPTEVFYYYAKYIDLLDYGALLFCCKDLHDRLHEDLVFKKCVFDHSPFNIQNPKSKSSVRRRFIEYNAKLAARNNDPDLLFFYFPTLECYSILQQLRPVSPHLEKKLGRSNLLQLIDSADADKLLSFIIETFLSSLDSEPLARIGSTKTQMIVDFIFMIADQIIKPTEDIKELEQRPERKTTSLVLDLFKKCEDYAWVKLTELNIKKNTAMQYVQHLGTKGAAPYMTTLFYFQEKFPQYKWNPNHPLGNVHLTGGGFVKNLEYLKDDFNHEMTIVDYTIACGDREMFELCLKAGGKMSPTLPYFWLACSDPRSKKFDEWIDKLIELGADPNLLSSPTSSKSYLYYYVSCLDYWKDITLVQISKLIAHGANFLEHESQEISMMREGDKKHFIFAVKKIQERNAALSLK